MECLLEFIIPEEDPQGIDSAANTLALGRLPGTCVPSRSVPPFHHSSGVELLIVLGL